MTDRPTECNRHHCCCTYLNVSRKRQRKEKKYIQIQEKRNKRKKDYDCIFVVFEVVEYDVDAYLREKSAPNAFGSARVMQPKKNGSKKKRGDKPPIPISFQRRVAYTVHALPFIIHSLTHTHTCAEFESPLP